MSTNNTDCDYELTRTEQLFEQYDNEPDMRGRIMILEAINDIDGEMVVTLPFNWIKSTHDRLTIDEKRDQIIHDLYHEGIPIDGILETFSISRGSMHCAIQRHTNRCFNEK
ncbi:hypothetical protein KOR42_05600 [Thalassoglobus neptunius]|uniref:Mor transcription activator family protein n=1 Tax=Thalassoglobus neptunius TaxID=1938619 RepID=A0A5C5X5A9_9PLAN|nr:hypothetical protein [Thalassoglobus neptunius]TWT57202.1 hypothetical protein KOR42_05600 [Thalassoglobus neptunius]